MTATLLWAKDLKTNLIDSLKNIISSRNYSPEVVIISVGDDPASKVYVHHKKRTAEKLGIKIDVREYPSEVSQKELLQEIKSLNEDTSVSGIMVQLPVPSSLNEEDLLSAINYKKDIDGIHPYNLGLLTIGKPVLVPATPLGILKLIKHYKISTEGKHCVVVGRSRIVGRPVSILLSQKPYNATCTIAHSYTDNLAEITSQADILVVAMGRPEFITSRYLKKDAVVIDVGIHRRKDGTLCGDVRLENVKHKVKAITPVPGGVGAMTVISLMINIVKAYEWQNNIPFSL